ncbi:MAG: NAD(P)H-dependent oxidoreductase [Pseudomonadota bacterium]
MSLSNIPHVDPADIRHLVVLGHPDPDSFNAGVARAYCTAVEQCGQRAELRDLYAIGFDPLLRSAERTAAAGFEPAPDVARELALLEASAVVVLVYPLWFGMPPAIIKGYVDRVLGAGFGPQEIKLQRHAPLLDGKRLVIATTSATTRPWLEEQGQWVSLRQAFDVYLATIFGLESNDHIHFDAVVEGMDQQRAGEILAQVTEQARKTSAEILAERHAAQTRYVMRHGAPEFA